MKSVGKEFTKSQLDELAKKLKRSIQSDAHFSLFRRMATARALEFKIANGTSHKRLVQAGRKNYVINLPVGIVSTARQ